MHAHQRAHLDLLDASAGTEKIPKDVATVVRNNGGGHFNHSFFWKIMGKPASTNGASTELKVRFSFRFCLVTAVN